MIELEKTYLIKYIPEGLENCESKVIRDMYIPSSSVHPVLRLRQNGDKYEMTKKEPVEEGDSSKQLEQTIILTKNEFDEIWNNLDGKKVSKKRCYLDYEGRTAEVDVFQDELEGLVVVDFEFDNEEEKDAFQIPEFCLIDITQEEFIAGGMICGKKYSDIEGKLNNYGYKKII